MSRVLILTGAAGFIGFNFLKKFVNSLVIDKYNFIYSIDKMGYATKYNSEEYRSICKNKNIFSIEKDINSLKEVDNIFNTIGKKDCYIDILDFASESHVDNSIKEPFSIYEQNATLPSSLLSWIGKENWGNIKNYWHISTDEIYGEIEFGKINDTSNWFTTTNNFKPSNPYSASKAAQDCFLISLKHTFGLPVKFIRMANQFGKHQHKEKMLPASILRAINGESIKIYGEGKNIRQWTPVDVTVDIFFDIIAENIEIADVLHISNRFGIYNNNQIIEKLVKCLEKKNVICNIEYIEDRKGHDMCYALDSTQKIDSYFDGLDFDRYLGKVVDFYISNKDLYNI